ncbi:transposase [Streptomyces sp. LZ34]
MTDGQWALPAPLLPAAGNTGGRGGGPEKWDRRPVLDAIFYLVRGGIAWRTLPADFPPHQTAAPDGRTRPSTPCSTGGSARGRGAGSTRRCVNVRVWPTGVAQCRPRP